MQSEALTPNQNYFPTRPKTNTTSGRTIPLAANYFKFCFTDPSITCFYKYAVILSPQIPEDSNNLRKKIWREGAEKIKSHLGHTIFNNTTCYSKLNISEQLSIPVTLQDTEYTIEIKWTNPVDPNSYEALSLYKRFFTQIIRKLHFIPIRRNYFDTKNSHKVDNLEVWPGFNSAVNIFPDGILLNINVCHRVLRPDTALSEINKMGQRGGNDIKAEIDEFFKGAVVLTRYNNDKTYIIDGVDFTKCPKDKFTMKDDKEMGYLQYYQEKYNRTITDLNQPLLVCIDKDRGRNKNTKIKSEEKGDSNSTTVNGTPLPQNDSININSINSSTPTPIEKKIYLIPELCYLTGLTDEMRNNFNLMKNLAVITKGTAQGKMKECVGLIDSILQKDKCKEDIDRWGISIKPQPVRLHGRKLDAGNIVMHNKGNSRFSFNIDTSDDIDRKIQTEMYSQPNLNRWIVFYGNRDEQTVQTMMDTFKQVKKSFNYPLGEPKLIQVNGANIREWEKTIDNTVSSLPGIQIALLAIPGSRGKGQLYNDVKRLMTSKYGIPSQVVLAGTLNKPRGLRSVINKVLIQMNAKIGGEPWAISDMPFTKQPTMVIGVDIVNKNGRSYLGCVGSYNNMLTRFHSTCKVVNSNTGTECGTSLSEAVEELFNKFKQVNNIAPQHIIILRDGLAVQQVKLIEDEVKKVKQFLSNDVKLTYVVLNKRNTLKVFSVDGNDSFVNIPPGTLVDNTVVNGECYDFYLISQKTNQGLSQATHYKIAYDDYNVSPEEIHEFIYKNCYLYYNWTGGIKVPAPCQYARKLAVLVAEKLSTGREVSLPSEKFNNDVKSLYFL